MEEEEGDYICCDITDRRITDNSHSNDTTDERITDNSHSSYNTDEIITNNSRSSDNTDKRITDNSRSSDTTDKRNTDNSSYSDTTDRRNTDYNSRCCDYTYERITDYGRLSNDLSVKIKVNEEDWMKAKLTHIAGKVTGSYPNAWNIVSKEG